MPRKKQTYEQLMIRIEEILSDMENSEISLDDSMKSYEEGIKLCNKMYKMLNDAEAKIKILSDEEEKDYEG